MFDHSGGNHTLCGLDYFLQKEGSLENKYLAVVAAAAVVVVAYNALLGLLLEGGWGVYSALLICVRPGENKKDTTREITCRILLVEAVEVVVGGSWHIGKKGV